LIEAYGTGIPKIMRSYADCKRKPELQSTGNAFKITLPNRNAGNYKAAGNVISFSENEEKVIALLDKQNEIVRKDVENALAISQAMAVRILRGLVDKEAIQVIGGGKNIRYRLVPSNIRKL
jgi:ATP-dependent DNA helicase RecG